MKPDRLTVHLGRLTLSNSVMTASGTAGYGDGLARYGDLASLGAFVTKGISLHPRQGNPPPRVVETPAGMLNAIGLANIGLDRFVSEKLPKLASMGVTVIANIFAESMEEFGLLAGRLSETPGISALEVNISCPNVSAGGMHFGQDPRCAALVTQTVRESAPHLPLIVKLSPEAPQIKEVAQAVEAAGADALCVMNTIRGLAIDIDTRRPRLANVFGGLSGPAIKPLALRFVHEVSRCVRIPVVGVGGISDWKDAAEFILAGASAVQVGTALLSNPLAPFQILEGLRDWVDRSHGPLSLLIGSMKP